MSSPRSSKGNGAFADAIAALEERRTTALNQVVKIDAALSALREMA